MDEAIRPGCGAQLSPNVSPRVEHSLNASPACYALDMEVTAFELRHGWLVGRCHQMTVDAYGAQHAGQTTRPIRVAYSLVGLHLALDRGLTGIQVRDAHSRMGKPDATWPSFARPSGFADRSIVDVARAGVQANSPEWHAAAVLEWAKAVWAWWEPAHRDVQRLTEKLLGEWLRLR